MATEAAGCSPQTTSYARGRMLIVNPISLLTVLALIAMVLIPIIEITGRRTTGFGIPGATNWVQHLTLWLTFLGGILATSRSGHLRIGTVDLIGMRPMIPFLEKVCDTVTVSSLLGFCIAATTLVTYEVESADLLGGWLPIWVAISVIPIALFIMSGIVVFNSSRNWRTNLLIAVSGSVVVLAILSMPVTLRVILPWLAIPLLVLLGFLGLPIFILLGSAALLLFIGAQIPIAAIPSETYRIITQPVFPSIPLFCLTGSILAAGGAPSRITGFINAWTDWLPGGASISAVLACALFTAITGASGVTILALGGLLLPVLMATGLPREFTTGLLTASGSVGLLFPPSLPVILYGVYGHVPIDRLFLASFCPGILLIVMLTGFSIYSGRRIKTEKHFDFRRAMGATWTAKGDLLLPLIIIAGFFSGVMTLVETAALTALWAIVLETIFHRQLRIRKNLVPTMIDSSVMIGALMMVIGLASGLVLFFVDAQVPSRITAWVTSVISSKWIFLLTLNAMLLLVGAFMDIFSAIVIIVPLIVPIGLAFGVDPLHLGVVFLANLELGYLTPPVGMNLFLASLRFRQPLLKIWRSALPFLVIFSVWVLVIIFVPGLSVGIEALISR
ncbi:MAG: TRAP transporter large permease subunit [Deltaproteobacteria bacterium]|nr:TRAP transporter large permease subunit [Deltaproteobacteria bacterium]